MVACNVRREFFLLACLLVLAMPAYGAMPDFATLVERNAAAIVNISTEQRVSAATGNSDLDELLRQLQPDELTAPGEEEPPLRRRGGVGSGFVMSEDGYVITNHHVVASAERIIVTLSDRREYDATVVGSDALSDVALLKVDATDLHAVRFGDSDQLRVGDWVLAIGSPFGLEFSAAAGIVSAKSRSVPTGGSSNYVSFIQTDVAINQGNSGGPLFNTDGDVVGINAQILSSTGGSNGISFAIPGNMALDVIAQLRESGAVERGLLGVMIKDVDQGLARAFDMDRPRGAFVDEVQPGSPAEAAGVRNNDIIVGFNDTVIEQSADLPFHVGQVRPGSQATLQVMRRGDRVELPVVVGGLPVSPVAASSTLPGNGSPVSLALEVAELERPVSGTEQGVLIRRVEEGAAHHAGLRAGDVIVSLNHRKVGSVEDFKEIAGALEDHDYIPVRILRQGRGTTLVMELR